MPRTDLLLADPRLAEAERRLGRALVKAAVSRAQQRARDGQIAPEEVAEAAVAELPARATALTPVLNATGVLVHTNLGRAPLSAASATSSGAICPFLARCWARPTAALTRARPSLRSASARRGSASSRSVRGTLRLLSTSRTIPRRRRNTASFSG